MSKLILEEFSNTARRILERAKIEKRLVENPTKDELRKMVEKEKEIKKNHL